MFRCWFSRGKRRHRHSLQGRLARSFVIVSVLTLAAAFAVMVPGRFHMGAQGPPWHARVVFPAVAVAGIAGVITAQRITRPLRRLEEAVDRLDLRDLSLRVPVEGDDEVSALARSFNRMVDRLEAEERARRQLFADVAHELRHPLAVLKGRLEMMQDGVVPLNPEQVLNLQDNVIALSRLVGDLRDLSLAEVGGLSLNMAPLNLAQLIVDLLEDLEPAASDKGVELAADVAPDLPLITADAHRLGQVLVNLVANALQHTPAGGRVEVRARAGNGAVTVEVSDTGEGIDPADLPHVFDRFFRSDRSRTRATGGSGLGLAIVRSLVGLHGGTVRVDSRLGEGSRFTMTLPLSPR